MNSHLIRALCFGACLIMAGGSATAGVVISGTRVVYPGAEKEVTIRLTNKGDTPALVQAWLDDGDIKSTPDKVRVPFLLTPPIFRMEGEKGQSMRLSYTGEPLPADRESLFWLNVLDVPPAGNSKSNSLQFAFRTRIKVFFRPAGLEGGVADAFAALQWQLKPASKGMSLEVTNPTPYHVSFNEIAVVAGGKEQVPSGELGGMVSPFSSLVLPMSGLGAAVGQAEVRAEFINDYGAPVEQRFSLTP